MFRFNRHLYSPCLFCFNHTVKDAKIAIIGAGKMTKLLLNHLVSQKVSSVTIINRSLASIEELQTKFPNIQITPRLMDDLYSVISESDIIFPSTSSAVPIINPHELSS